jgi:DegV family protein with EDD domain
MVSIITDSTADLGEELARKFNLTVIPLIVTIGGKDYKDGIDLSQSELFNLVQQYGELPKTAAPSAGEFLEVFKRSGECIFIGISSKLSATIQNAQLAANMLPDGYATVIDSLNLSTGVGLLAIRAAELRDQGLSASEIVAHLGESRGKVRTAFVIDTMDFLYKGGRCSAIQAIAGSVLKIHPIIEVRQDGTLGVKSKARGTLEKAQQMMLDEFEGHLPELDARRVFITHSCGEAASVQTLVEGVERLAHPKEICVTQAGSVISSHCGPGTAGILYFVN